MAQESSDVTVGGTNLTRNDDDRDRTSDVEKRTDDLELSADDGSEKTENIKAQIEETRADMGETIDAIQEKLSFSNISEQVSEQVNNAIETAKETVYDATVGKVVHFMKNTGREISGSSIVSTAKENPLPFVLIGLGAGLLAYQGFSKKSGGGTRQYRRPNQFSSGGHSRSDSLIRSAQGGLRSVKGSVSNAAGSVKESVSNAAGSAIDGVTRAAENTYASAGDFADRVVEKAGDLGTKAQETYEQYLEERPWAIGVVALAAGAAIGMAIPSTRYEGQLMGEARINLMNKVQETAGDFVDKAKQMASDAGQNVKEEVQNLAEKTLA